MLALCCLAAGANISVTHSGLLYSVTKCVCNDTGSLSDTLSQMYECFHDSLFRCQQKSNPQAWEEPVTHQTMMCGILYSGMKLNPTVWKLQVYLNFNIHLDILHFLLPCSSQCEKAALYVRSTNITDLKYCGKRLAWSIGLLASYVELEYRQLDDTYVGFHFILVYEAVDTKSPLTSAYHMSGEPEASVTMLGFVKTLDTNAYLPISYLFVADHLDVACFSHFSLIPYGIFFPFYDVYDGPGKCSPRLTHTKSITVCFSRFVGFIVSTGSYNSPVTRRYQSIKWYSKRNRNNRNCFHQRTSEGSYLYSLNGTSGSNCIWTFTDHQLQLLQIERLIFEGPDMVSTLSPIICQYGGLVIKYRSMNGQIHTLTSICAANQKDVAFIVPQHQSMKEVFIIFITFHYYSSGVVHVMYKKSQCYFYDISSCNELGYILSKTRYDVWYEQSEKGNSICHDIWVLHNLDNRDVTNTQCGLKSDSEWLNFLSILGPYIIPIKNYDFPLTQFKEDLHKTINERYRFTFDMITWNDYPVDMRNHYTTIIVDRLHTSHVQSVSHIRGLALSTNLSLMQQHAQVIHIRMQQSIICSLDESNISVVVNETITVLLGLYLLPEKGLMFNNPCVTNEYFEFNTKFQYSVFIFDYLSYESMILDHGNSLISVTLIDVNKCTIPHQMEVEIWENHMSVRMVRYFKWKNTNSLHWNVRTSLGFRLLITMKCSTQCTPLCSVVVKFHTSSNSVNKGLFSHVGLITKISDARNVTWQDADAYCTEHGGYLPTITHLNKVLFLDAAEKETRTSGQNKLSSRMFAGLYKQSKVSGTD